MLEPSLELTRQHRYQYVPMTNELMSDLDSRQYAQISLFENIYIYIYIYIYIIVGAHRAIAAVEVLAE